MDTPEAMWRVGARFLRLVLILDALIIAFVVGWTLLDGSTSVAAIERGIWIACLAIVFLWLIHLMASHGFAQMLPGGQFGPLSYDATRYRMNPETSFEMTWVTVAILATLSFVALAVRGLYL
jgi:hypothetical protein